MANDIQNADVTRNEDTISDVQPEISAQEQSGKDVTVASQTEENSTFEALKVPADIPEAPVPEPEAPAEVPEVPVEEPEAPAEESEVPAEVPEVPAEEPEVPEVVPEVPAEEPEVPAEAPEVPAEEPEVPAEEPGGSENVAPEDNGKEQGEDLPVDTVFGEEFNLDALKSAYKEKNYLFFGAQAYEPFIDTASSLAYLEECGFGNSGLRQARVKITQAQTMHAQISLNEDGVHYCDFCGSKLGAEYDVLNDGRERCYQCSKTVVETVEELQKIFVEVIKNMESMFGISFYTAIDVKTLSAKKLAKQIGIRFVSSPQYDGRVLGFAQDDKGTYHVCLENQSPYLCAVATMAHELTHIWQYLHWNDKRFKKRYYTRLAARFPHIDPRKIVYEGMAKWIEVQYLFLINEKDRAYLEAAATLQRNDEYGVGLALYMEEYEFTEDTFIEGATPFDDKANPLHSF